eukprot:TRINITY_DN14965_c0_g1_i1.p1 TRINITY_DN14965_c0_g1~~TRINITY_DN14965_c0_g1_i1.p1  ORF type:complete len:712 (+),score=143.13 TRINITY_DN14965_c0_g1_i1:3-2138(+)
MAVQQADLLLLASAPTALVPTLFDREFKNIRQQVKGALSVELILDATILDVSTALSDSKAQIAQFSGHGIDKAGLCFTRSSDGKQLVVDDVETMAKLFGLHTDRLICVVLNCCLSEEQAEAIAKYIPFVVGTTTAVGSEMAIEFSQAFYACIARGNSLQFAYDSAVIVSGLAKPGYEGAYRCFVKAGSDPSTLVIHRSAVAQSLQQSLTEVEQWLHVIDPNYVQYAVLFEKYAASVREIQELSDPELESIQFNIRSAAWRIISQHLGRASYAASSDTCEVHGWLVSLSPQYSDLHKYFPVETMNELMTMTESEWTALKPKLRPAQFEVIHSDWLKKMQTRQAVPQSEIAVWLLGIDASYGRYTSVVQEFAGTKLELQNVSADEWATLQTKILPAAAFKVIKKAADELSGHPVGPVSRQLQLSKIAVWLNAVSAGYEQYSDVFEPAYATRPEELQLLEKEDWDKIQALIQPLSAFRMIRKAASDLGTAAPPVTTISQIAAWLKTVNADYDKYASILEKFVSAPSEFSTLEESDWDELKAKIQPIGSFRAIYKKAHESIGATAPAAAAPGPAATAPEPTVSSIGTWLRTMDAAYLHYLPILESVAATVADLAILDDSTWEGMTGIPVASRRNLREAARKHTTSNRMRVTALGQWLSSLQPAYLQYEEALRQYGAAPDDLRHVNWDDIAESDIPVAVKRRLQEAAPQAKLSRSD